MHVDGVDSDLAQLAPPALNSLYAEGFRNALEAAERHFQPV